MWKHKSKISHGIKGELSYIQEEFDELKDVHGQGYKIWGTIEASDIVIAIGKFTNKHYSCPLLFVIILGYLRIPYKWMRNILLGLLGYVK